MTGRTVYADNAATTGLSERALSAMMPYLAGDYGNPSSLHRFGRTARLAVETARCKVAECLGAEAGEIYFTGSGTESDNWAIKSAVRLMRDRGRHVITTSIEHHAVLHTLEHLEKEEIEVTYLGVDECGNISLDELISAIRKDTVLITIMTANNEIGTILPVREIGAIAREHGILFHTDAVQAAGHIPIDVKDMCIDLLSLSGHKFKGPKGTGVLYVRNGIRLPSDIYGGAQERNMRAGTENIAGIIGLAAALEEAFENLDQNSLEVASKRDRLIGGVLNIPEVFLTGDPIARLPGIASFAVEGIEGESMVMMLDRYGICASSGSACSSGSGAASHVLQAIGLKPHLAHGSLRLSISEDTTDEDIDYILEKLPVVVESLRRISPLWDSKKNR